MKKNLFVIGIGFLLIGASIFSACTKEGPMGPAGTNGTNGTNGANGTNGTNGVDGGTNCQECHNPATVTMAATQYELSKHSFGEAAFGEAGNATCAPCHESEGFKYVVASNILSTFTLNTTTNKYVNNYVATSSTAYGEFTCNTCHSSLHTTYGKEDFSPLTSVAPVSSTMWGGALTFDAIAKGGKSNLCIKCHQPRPITASTNGNVIDYAGLAANPTAVFYDPASSTNILKPSYRTGAHYGTVGAIYVGKGGVEFGTGYSNSPHTAIATCQDCHMASINGTSGGHTFFAAGNYNGCNQTGCHLDNPLSSASTKVVATQTAAKTALNNLAAKLKIGTVEILSRNPDSEGNLWYGKTTNNYDGYFNFYDPSSNPEGETNNPGGVFQNPSPSNSWTADQKAHNLTLPLLTLTNAQMGAVINFQLCLREYSLGVHNTNYTMTLLNNSIAALP